MSRPLDELLARARRDPAEESLWIEAFRLAARLDRLDPTVDALLELGALSPPPGPGREALARGLFETGWGLGDPRGGFPGPITAVAVAPTQDRLAVATATHGLHLVRLPTGERELRLDFDGAQVLAFPRSGRGLVAAAVRADAGGPALALARWEAVRTVMTASLSLPDPRWNRVLDLSPCGGLVVLAGSRGEIAVATIPPWARSSPKPALRFTVVSRSPAGLLGEARISPDLRFVVVDRGRFHELFTLESGSSRELAIGFSDRPPHWSYSPDGLWLASIQAGPGAAHLSFHPLHDEGPAWHLELPGVPAVLAWPPGGKAETPGHLLDPRRRRVEPSAGPPRSRLLEPDLPARSSWPRVRDVLGGGLVLAPRYHPAPITALRVLGDPPRLESFDPEGGAVLWCLETGRCLGPGPPRSNPPSDGDGVPATIGGRAGRIHPGDAGPVFTPDGAKARKLVADPTQVTQVAVAPGGTELATLDSAGALAIHDLGPTRRAERTRRVRIPPGPHLRRALVYSACGRWLFYSEDGCIRMLSRA